jgi:hypothetical protein
VGDFFRASYALADDLLALLFRMERSLVRPSSSPRVIRW